MHRLAALSSCAFLALFHGASLAHADLDFQFANMTELDPETLSFSIDVQMIGLESDPPIVMFGMGVVTGGLAVTSIHNISPLAYHEWFEYEEAENTYLYAGWDGGKSVIEPGPDPVGLIRLDLLVTEPIGPWTIDVGFFTFREANGEIIATGQDSYNLTIPVPTPATIALVACGLCGAGRRRCG
ncbi:MAG: hypothetical protein P8J45_05480 [Phycisphaerales bacterium]|nr:hypothetical protein [Phycisphaerales bacterium]